MKIIFKKLTDIKPYDRNAKRHNVDWVVNSILVGSESIQEETAKTKYILEKAIDQPIVIDSQGVIIKGHGRLKAAQKIGLKEFPCIVRDDLTPEQVKLIRIADNRSGEGGWDYDLLGTEVAELIEGLPEIDMEIFGISEGFYTTINQNNNIENDGTDFEPGTVEEQGKLDELQPKIIKCPHCGEKFDARIKN